MIKWKDTTAGGYKILWREEIKEGERKGWFIGEIRIQDTYNIFRAWTPEGVAYLGTPELCLVPAEPEVVYTGWLSVYTNSTSALFTAKTYAILGGVLGFIRVDWRDDGTFTVTKEEV